MDWRAFELPIEGARANQPRAGTLACRDVPTCAPTDSLDDARKRVRGTDWNVCVAVVQDRNVQGMVDLKEYDTESGEVQQFMQADARTFRPFAEPETILDAMKKSDLDTVLVTTSAGQLLGALRRADLSRAVESANDQNQ